MIELLIIGGLSITTLILGYTTRNLLKKNEKQEDILIGYLQYLDKLSKIIEASDEKLKEIDSAGMFEKDDDVGMIFQSILQVQEIMNSFSLKNVTDGEEGI
jgi:hypothetical protein